MQPDLDLTHGKISLHHVSTESRDNMSLSILVTVRIVQSSANCACP